MMKKLSKNKNKILISLVALFCSLMCVSIGFATWITASDSYYNINGKFDADDYAQIPLGELQCVSDVNASNIRFSTNYGFVDEDLGIYSTSIYITGSFTFNVSNAKLSISSMNSTEKRFSLTMTIGLPNIDGFSYVFNYDGSHPAFSGFSNSASKISTATSITHDIILNESEYSQDEIENLGFCIKVNGPSSSFPNLSSGSFNISIEPGEYIV